MSSDCFPCVKSNHDATLKQCYCLGLVLKNIVQHCHPECLSAGTLRRNLVEIHPVPMR